MVGQATHDKLRRLQDLLRREIPSGDAAAIFDRALTVLLEKVEKAKLGKTKRTPRPPSTRPGTDEDIRTPPPAPRYIAAYVKSEVAAKDGERCGFVSTNGRRCTERTFLEFHHLHPYAKRGASTVDNISLRCRRHNQYEAELVFGPRSRTFVMSENGGENS